MLERHDLLLPHPVPQQPGGVAHVRVELHVGAPVGESHHRVGTAEDLRDRLGVHVDLAEAEDRAEILLDREIEEDVERVLAALLRDRRDAPSPERAVLRPLGLLDDHQVPALRERRVRAQRRFDLGPQLRARRRVAIGAQLLGVGALEDRQPGGHAAEHLTVLHGEPVHDTARIAERHRPDALARPLEGDVATEPEKAGLRGVVGGQLAAGPEPGDGGDEHDGAALHHGRRPAPAGSAARPSAPDSSRRRTGSRRCRPHGGRRPARTAPTRARRRPGSASPRCRSGSCCA